MQQEFHVLYSTVGLNTALSYDQPAASRQHKRAATQPTAFPAATPAALLLPHLAGLLSDNNRLSELGKILDKFGEIVADQRGEVKATVTTAEVS